MHPPHDLFHLFGNETLHEIDKIRPRLRGNEKLIAVITFADEILDGDFVTVLLKKQLEHGGTCRHGVIVPIEQFLFGTRQIQQKEMIKKRGETHYADLRIFLEPAIEIFQHPRKGFGINGVHIPVFHNVPAVGVIVVDLRSVP